MLIYGSRFAMSQEDKYCETLIKCIIIISNKSTMDKTSVMSESKLRMISNGILMISNSLSHALRHLTGRRDWIVRNN